VLGSGVAAVAVVVVAVLVAVEGDVWEGAVVADVAVPVVLVFGAHVLRFLQLPEIQPV
jgi:hypothetical protein